MDVVLEALHTLSALAALAQPARVNMDRSPDAPALLPQQFPELPPGPLAVRQPLDVRQLQLRCEKLLAHLDVERFHA